MLKLQPRLKDEVRVLQYLITEDATIFTASRLTANLRGYQGLGGSQQYWHAFSR